MQDSFAGRQIAAAWTHCPRIDEPFISVRTGRLEWERVGGLMSAEQSGVIKQYPTQKHSDRPCSCWRSAQRWLCSMVALNSDTACSNTASGVACNNM